MEILGDDHKVQRNLASLEVNPLGVLERIHHPQGFSFCHVRREDCPVSRDRISSKKTSCLDVVRHDVVSGIVLVRRVPEGEVECGKVGCFFLRS